MPAELAKTLPRSTLMSEQEWRNAGIQMSRGWQHDPPARAPHLLPTHYTDPPSGKVDPELERSAKDRRELPPGQHEPREQEMEILAFRLTPTRWTVKKKLPRY